MACLLIEMNQLDQAKTLLLAVDKTVTQQDWHDKHVLAMLYIHEGNFSEAEILLLDGVENALQPKSQKIFKASLNLLQLKQKQADKVIASVEAAEIINFPEHAMIYAHALAQTQQNKQAQQMINQLSGASKEVIALGQNIQKRYLSELVIPPEQLKALDDEISRQEFVLCLRVG